MTSSKSSHRLKIEAATAAGEHARSPRSLKVAAGAFALVAALGVSVTPAWAGAEVRTYPALNCVQENASAPTSQAITYLMGWASNSSTSKQFVECPLQVPILSDTGVSFFPTKVNWSAKVYDGSTTGSVKCTFLACATPSSCSFGAEKSTSYSGKGSSTLSNSNEAGGYWKSAFLRCELPGKGTGGSSVSGISSYQITAFE